MAHSRFVRPPVVLSFLAVAAGGVACKDKPSRGPGDDGAVAAVEVRDAATAGADADAAVLAHVPTRPERPVFSLGDNLLLAHRAVDGDAVIDAGSVGFARFIRFDKPVARWRLAGDVHGHRVARAGRGGSLELPLTEAQAGAARGLALELVAAADARPSRRVVKVGGRGAGAVEVGPGRAWYQLALEPGRLVAGENQVVIEGGEVALATIRVFADGERAAAEPAPLARAAWDGAARTLSLAEGSGLAWYVHLPLEAHLVATVAGDCRIEVEARTDDGARAGGLLGGDATHVDLSAVGDQAVRLEVTARDCPRAVVADPVVTVPGPPPTPRVVGPPPRFVVLWVMDALRADRVRPFAPGARPEVPNFERLAATGAVFRQFYVGGNESQTSHATLWTGTYPAVHEVRTTGEGGSWRMPRSLPVLGELVAAAGLAPVGVTGNGFVTENGGYARGFAEYRNMMREKGVTNGILYGVDILGAALTRLDARKAEPALLFLGTVDTHGPWIARKPWIDRYDGPAPYTGPFQRHGTMRELGIVAGKMGCSKVPPPRDVERLRAIYDSAVSYHDERLGDLLAALHRMGIHDETMIVITSDHGEELFEDGRCGHGATLRETLTRVPLLVHYPPRVAAAVVDEGADGADVLPTILDALGASIPDHVQGESLLPRAAGDGRGWPRPSFASQYEYAHAMRVARWKMRVNRAGASVVHDLVADPDERLDLSRQRPTARRMLADGLGLFLATRTRWHKRTMGVVTNLAPGAAERLEAPP